MRPRYLLALCSLIAIAALAWIERANLAIWAAPDKTARPEQSDRAKRANEKFWQALHGGRYEELPSVIEGLTAAYLENPRDAETAAHIAFSHAWFGSERSRLERVPATMTEHIALARRYFAEAARLAPKDERYKGFLASMELAEGKIHGDEKLLRRGYFNLMASVEGWPEFNLFTAGYVLSGLPFDDPMYAEALEYEWRNIDVCVGEKFDRRGADATKYLALETTSGPKRACWNSAIAPHNFEGFFLNLGDMLVKQGDADTARRVYAYARLSKTYAEWPFRTILEERIAQAQENIALFRNPKPGERTRTMMAQSAFSCVGCHQQ
jgi:hypothetical protein